MIYLLTINVSLEHTFQLTLLSELPAPTPVVFLLIAKSLFDCLFIHRGGASVPVKNAIFHRGNHPLLAQLINVPRGPLFFINWARIYVTRWRLRQFGRWAKRKHFFFFVGLFPVLYFPIRIKCQSRSFRLFSQAPRKRTALTTINMTCFLFFGGEKCRRSDTATPLVQHWRARRSLERWNFIPRQTKCGQVITPRRVRYVGFFSF